MITGFSWGQACSEKHFIAAAGWVLAFWCPVRWETSSHTMI